MKIPFRITIKTYMGLILLVLTIIGIVNNGIANTLPQVLIALVTTIFLDLIINYFKKKTFILPDSATISALFIATALSMNQPWYIPLIASAIAIISKHLIKIKNKHIFNPAAFGLLSVILIFNSQMQWWLTQPFWLVIIFGLFITYKLKRFHLILSYLITSLVLAISYTLITHNSISLSSLLFNVNIFFMFFMLIEPLTSPITKKARIIYGILTAIFSFIVLLLIPQYEPSITALILADLFVPFLNRIEIAKVT